MHRRVGLKSILNKLQLASLYLMIALLFACSFGSDKGSDKKSSNYQLSFSSPKWTRMNPGTADHAFYHTKTHSIILLNTLCEKYESTSLQHLISNMLGGIDDIQIEKEETLSYSKRDSLRSFVTGKTDGIPIYLLIQTVRKNNCIYDFIMISQTSEKRQLNIEDFNNFLAKTKIN